MDKLLPKLVLPVFLAVVVGVFIWYEIRTPADAPAAIITTPVATAIPTPEPTTTPSSSVTPTATPTPNSRVDYVRAQLAVAGIEPASFDAALSDRRLKVYPVKTVAYKEPNWKIIEDKLYSAVSVQKGKDYIQAHRVIFDKTELDYGIKKEALAGLIAMETDFGKNSGTYPIFNVLYSRMMRWSPEKWKAQADQLVAFTTYCTQSKIDCYSVKGSYAGAFGIVQFMPNSLLAYGVDADGSGVIDLSREADAIPSAANYLKKHGWDQDQFKALARYYGSSEGYPTIILTYADLLAQ